MPEIQVTNLLGLNLFVNPLNQQNGELIRSVNMDSFPFGAKTKRPGYGTYLGTPDNSQVNTLFNWTKNDGTTFFNYRVSGTKIYYSAQGTGVWTVAGNGTVASGAHVGYAVLDNTLILGDGVGSTRHTTSGTSFTNTTLAPPGEFFAQYQNRIYIGGTSSTLFYSTTNDATNWNTSGTSDSSSLTIPGAGKLGAIFVSADRLTATKNSGLIYRWNGNTLVDLSTDLGPSSPYSLAGKGGFFFWLNRVGYHGYGGNRPQLLSNSIQPQIYNTSGSAIEGTVFNTAPGAVHKYDYLAAVGNVTDDFTNNTVANCIHKYDYQKNEFLNYSYNKLPTAFLSYKDASGDDQLIFGDSTGQCYTVGNGVKDDNGNPIAAEMEFYWHDGVPHLEKEMRHFWAFFNPGNEARVQIAIENTFNPNSKRWIDLGDCSSGVAAFNFPVGSRGRFLFVRVMESSKNANFSFYGFVVDADPMVI